MAKKGGNNNGNLKPVRTKDEARERGRNGGIASGQARRRKKLMRECAQRVLEAEIPKGARKGIESLVGELGEDEDTLFTVAAAAAVKGAISGDMAAFRLVLDMARMVDDGRAEAEDVSDDPLSAALDELAAEMEA